MASWGKTHFLSTLILFAVIIQACSDQDQVPSELIQPEKMTHLMIQVHLLESKVSRLRLKRDTSQFLYDHFERLMLEENGLDTAQFNKSMDFYTTNPKIFKKVYAAVVDSLLEMEAREKLRIEERKRLAEEKEEEKKAKQDSLRKARKNARNLRDISVPKPDSVLQNRAKTTLKEE